MELSDKLRLVRDIAHSGMSANAKIAGVVLALAIMERQGYARLSKSTLSERTGLPRSTLTRALAELESGGFFMRKITGRATMWFPVALISSEDSRRLTGGPSGGSQMAYQDDPYSTDSPGERADKRNR